MLVVVGGGGGWCCVVVGWWCCLPRLVFVCMCVFPLVPGQWETLGATKSWVIDIGWRKSLLYYDPSTSVELRDDQRRATGTTTWKVQKRVWAAVGGVSAPQMKNLGTGNGQSFGRWQGRTLQCTVWY